MLTSAIEAEGVGKQYLRGTAHLRHHTTLRDVLSEWGGRIVRRRNADQSGHSTEQFWALKDVSFSIRAGEVVGIIGRNGSGKSTLLKVISQITAPTTGEVRLNGRTGTLLEVGTGFHTELTGRENVYLNGTILGMSRAEIARKFDEIVAFSGVEDFIDTPIKRYSSGMQMRLAFAVAAYLDPEILVIDEVLAVGDADFQKKCLGKMEDISKDGRTVLFVSHNMAAVNQLCRRVIWLDGGRLVEDSNDTHAVTSRYLFGGENHTVAGEWRPSASERSENDYFALKWFRVRDESGDTINAPIRNDGHVIVEVGLSITKLHPNLTFGYALTNEVGVCVYWTTIHDADGQRLPIALGDIVLTSMLPRGLMNQGLFRLDFMSAIHSQEWLVHPAQSQSSVFLRISGLNESQYLRDTWPGVIAPVLHWDLGR